MKRDVSVEAKKAQFMVKKAMDDITCYRMIKDVKTGGIPMYIFN